MKIIKILFVCSFVFFSGSVFADTYPAISTFQYNHHSTNYASMSLGCQYWGSCSHTSIGRSNPESCVSGNSCIVKSYYNNVNDSTAIYNFTQVTVYSCPASGTVSGSSCINAPACTAPQVRNSSSGVCEAPPVTCTAGDTMNLSIPMGTYPPSGTPPTFKLSQDRTSVSSVLQTVSAGGCVYTIPLNAAKTGVTVHLPFKYFHKKIIK